MSPVLAPLKLCTVEGCELPHRARGLCGGHYARFQAKGDPLASVPLRNAAKPGAKRFDRKAVGGVQSPFGPDPAPVRRVGDHLRNARRSGEPFVDAWDEALSVGLAGLRRADRESWEKVLSGHRLVWMAAYDRTPGDSFPRALAGAFDG